MTARSSSLPAQPTARRARLDGLLFVFLLALAAYQAAQLPWLAQAGVSPLIVAIVIGAAYSNVMPGAMPADWAAGVNLAARRLLRIAVAFYGLRISAQELMSVGAMGLLMACVMVGSTLVLGVVLGRLLRIDRETALLTSAGSAICGAAAVLAFESTLRSEAHKSVVAVATVVLFGTLAMFLYPVLFHAGWLPLDSTALGIYIGGTVHEVAQVVATASAIDPATTDAATIVKMGRVAMLVPVLLVLAVYLGRRSRQSSAGGAGTGNGVAIPWFVLGFVALVAVNSLNILPETTVETINEIDTFALTMAMAAIGVETRFERMKQAGGRVLGLALALFLWLVVGGYGITLLLSRLL